VEKKRAPRLALSAILCFSQQKEKRRRGGRGRIEGVPPLQILPSEKRKGERFLVNHIPTTPTSILKIDIPKHSLLMFLISKKGEREKGGEKDGRPMQSDSLCRLHSQASFRLETEKRKGRRGRGHTWCRLSTLPSPLSPKKERRKESKASPYSLPILPTFAFYRGVKRRGKEGKGKGGDSAYVEARYICHAYEEKKGGGGNSGARFKRA